jgi:hypothetical protein
MSGLTYISCIGNKKSYNILAGKQLEIQPPTIPMILEKCIRMGLRETGCENVNLL